MLGKTSSLMFCIAVMDNDVDCRLQSRLVVCISQTTKQNVKLLVKLSGSDNKIEHWRRKTQICRLLLPERLVNILAMNFQIILVVVELVTMHIHTI
jgi:hypothetical protein